MKQQNTNRRYGLFSLLSLVVGTVIGSGIFVKNQDLFNTTSSAILTMITWGIMSLIILLMVFAFLEIASSTGKTGEVGTLSTWSNKFIGPKTSKAIGIIITYIYFPIILVILTNIASFQIISSIPSASSFSQTISANSWNFFGVTSAITLALILFVVLLNSKFIKSSKTLGIGGMFIKIMPLLLVIISVIIFAVSPSLSGSTITPLTDASTNTSITSSSTNSVKLVLLALPATMFSFDGFLYSISLQNEAKNKSTFKYAFVGGMIFVIIIYILFSYSIFIGGNGDYTITGVLTNLYPSQVNWLPTTVTVLVFISILSCTSGNSIVGSRQFSSLSEENTMYDPDGKMLLRNKSYIPQFAMLRLLMYALLWFVFLKGMDAIWIQASLSAGIASSNISSLGLTGYAADLGAIIAFIIYSIIMIAAIVNRKTKKVEVDKIKGFIPMALIASLIIGVAGLYQLYSIFSGLTVGSTLELTQTLTKIGTLFAMIVLFLFAWFGSNRVSRYTSTIEKKRSELIKLYQNIEIAPYFKTVNINRFNLKRRVEDWKFLH